jgi:hypothetical protein
MTLNMLNIAKTTFHRKTLTPNATNFAYIFHKVVYIILHLRHLIPRVNKIHKNTTQYKQFHNSMIDLVKVNNILLSFNTYLTEFCICHIVFHCNRTVRSQPRESIGTLNRPCWKNKSSTNSGTFFVECNISKFLWAQLLTLHITFLIFQ